MPATELDLLAERFRRVKVVKELAPRFEKLVLGTIERAEKS